MFVLLRQPLATPKLEVSTLRYTLARELDPKSRAMFGMRSPSAFTNRFVKLIITIRFNGFLRHMSADSGQT
jgi:hypothetical protein